MTRDFSEDSRVKIPVLVHFTRLGYEYISVKEHSNEIDPKTNIFTNQFKKALEQINGRIFSYDEIERLIQTISIKISAEDLGEAFYECLQKGIDDVKLIDFDNLDKNLFQVCTELTYKNDEDEFRPDIIPLLNGIPLAFIEVKIPNNPKGITAERNRINARFKNKKFRPFANLTQFMVFSNNMEYDSESLVPIQGAFYATPNYGDVTFNCFREEDQKIYSKITNINEEKEKFILKDTNLVSIKSTQEYSTNLSVIRPTNRIITSLFSKERYLFLLRYGIAYVKVTDKEGIRQVQKHIMRYPQLFATYAIQRKLDEGTKKGVIWHTQGSGKTALAYYNVKAITDYFQKKGQVAKFYFIVDRLDLLNQACDEFKKRGLKFIKVNSKKEFVENIGKIGSSGMTGENEINVVNIQKFSDESITKKSDYNVSVQRVYFLDEAHRSYNPKGSFLGNLVSSDPNAVMIALTGTPLIGDVKTTAIFGDYIHTYYYNQSISDGFTLKLIREGISTEYRIKLKEVLDKFEAKKGSIPRKDIFARPEYVECLTEFIVDDLKRFRVQHNEKSGGMVVCDSSEQAREVFKQLENYSEIKAALILHDEDDKSTRKEETAAFKKGEYDLLIVFNMLLTGFDAPILKRIYFGRVIKEHNLLQALTRVNRPYKKFRYGYIVDFADIRAEFDKTNQAYFAELQGELGTDFDKYDQIFKDQAEIETEIIEIEKTLFKFETDNMEIFSQQIEAIDDKSELLNLRKILETYKELYNIAKLLQYDTLTSKIDVKKITKMYSEVAHKIEKVNLKENIGSSEDISEILNIAFSEIEFTFHRLKPEELVIADKFIEIYEKLRRALERSRDKKDPVYVNLLGELNRLFAKKNLIETEDMTSDELKANIDILEDMYRKIKAKNRLDDMLCLKYRDDAKFMRVHKRLCSLDENSPCYEIAEDEPSLNKLLLSIKDKTDEMLLDNLSVIDNAEFFKGKVQNIAVDSCKENGIKITVPGINCLKTCISREYLNEREQAVI